MKRIYIFLLCFAVLLPVGGKTAQAKEQAGEQYLLLEHVKDKSKLLDTAEQFHIHADVIEEIGFAKVTGEKQKLAPFTKKLAEKVGADVIEKPIANTAVNETESVISGSPAWGLDGILELKEYLWFAAKQTDSYRTYQIERGHPDVKVALIDSGLDLDHPDLKASVNTNGGWNYIDGKPVSGDPTGHGTQTVGMINIIAPDVTITPYQVLDEKGGDSYNIMKAMVDAVNDGHEVINISTGSYTSLDREGKVLMKAYQRAANYAAKHQVLVFSSAGNKGVNLDEMRKTENKVHLPSALKHVVSVGSNMKSNNISPYSNQGREIEFTAPGGYLGETYDQDGMVRVTDLVLTTYPKGKDNTALDQMLNIPKGYSLSYGTSLAAPQVAGTAALVISEYRERHHRKPSAKQVHHILRKSALDLGKPGKDVIYGYGEVRAYQALKMMNKE